MIPAPRSLALVVVLVVIALFATSCSVDPAAVELTSTAPAADATTEATGTPAATPTPVTIEPDALARIISGSYSAASCAPAIVDELPTKPDCGWLTRPLHGGGTNLDVELPVLIFKATGDDPAPDPVIYLHGGPSDGILTNIVYFYEFIIEPYLDDRDVIIFDQRGTGQANPDLRCDSPYQWFSAYDEDPTTFVGRTARTCAHDLRVDGIDPEQFSRQRSADDVMVLARELGYEQFNLHGTSWGGILAYTVMQLHPEMVRSALLNSPLSIETDIAGSMPASFQEAMNAMQANCDLNPACAARHGNIVERYIRLFEALNENPELLVIGGVWPVELTGDELAYLLFGLFYIPEAIAMVPDILLDLENGNTDWIASLASVYGWGWGVDFTFLTYMCTDIVRATSQEQISAQETGIEAFDRVDDAPDGRGHSAEEICDRMKVGAANVAVINEERPTTPTIVFSGSMDPITPRSSGEELAALMPNGHFVGIDDLTHGITHDPCGMAIALAFLDDPTAEIDATCAMRENRDPFQFDQIAFTVPGS